jgi:hypothetical protein
MFGNSDLYNKHIQISTKEALVLTVKNVLWFFQTRSNLNILAIEEQSEDEHECEQCGIFFVSRQEMSVHRKTHNDNGQEIRSIKQHVGRIVAEGYRSF